LHFLADLPRDRQRRLLSLLEGVERVLTNADKNGAKTALIESGPVSGVALSRR